MPKISTFGVNKADSAILIVFMQTLMAVGFFYFGETLENSLKASVLGYLFGFIGWLWFVLGTRIEISGGYLREKCFASQPHEPIEIRKIESLNFAAKYGVKSDQLLVQYKLGAKLKNAELNTSLYQMLTVYKLAIQLKKINSDIDFDKRLTPIFSITTPNQLKEYCEKTSLEEGINGWKSPREWITVMIQIGGTMLLIGLATAGLKILFQ